MIFNAVLRPANETSFTEEVRLPPTTELIVLTRYDHFVFQMEQDNMFALTLVNGELIVPHSTVHTSIRSNRLT